MAGSRRTFPVLLAALVAVALALAAPARSALTAPVLLDPGNGASIQALPAFAWSAVPGADSSLFSPASDPALANLVEGQSGQPVETWATNYVPVFNLLPAGTYYWNVTPVDSEGNRGAPSPVSSFNWSWPSTTTPHVTD